MFREDHSSSRRRGPSTSTSRRVWRLQRRKPMCKLRRRHTRIALFLESQCGKLEHAQVATATHTCKARICKNEGAHESVNVLRCNQKHMGSGIWDRRRASVDLAKSHSRRGRLFSRRAPSGPKIEQHGRGSGVRMQGGCMERPR